MADFSVILVEPKYEGNIGSIARVMKNFGFEDLVLVKPPKLGREARRMSMHGFDVLEAARVVGSLREVEGNFDVLVATSAVSATDKNSIRSPVTPEALSEALKTSGKVGLVFGREDHGLLNEEISFCDILVSIPANPEYPTFNVVQSAAILLYELRRQEYLLAIKDKRKFRRLSRVEKDQMLLRYDELVEAVLEGEYEHRLAKKTFRSLVGRAFISSREAFTLIGVFRKAREKMQS